MPYTQVFESIDAGLLILDQNFHITEWNRWMEYHSGKLKDDVINKGLFDLYPELRQNWFVRSCKSVLHFGNFAFFSRKLHQYCFPFLLGAGYQESFEYMQQDCQVGPIRNDDGAVDGLYILVHDVTAVAIYEKKILSMANRDGLTGLFTRRYFDEQMRDEFSRFTRYGRIFSFLIIDLDFFKVVNDYFGHLFGDYVLKHLAVILLENTRDVDTVARYGGEEFAIILPETDVDQAKAKAESLRRIIEETEFQKGEMSNYITASFGVTSCIPGDDSPTVIIARADTALYEAKDLGRNAVRAAKVDI